MRGGEALGGIAVEEGGEGDYLSRCGCVREGYLLVWGGVKKEGKRGHEQVSRGRLERRRCLCWRS